MLFSLSFDLTVAKYASHFRSARSCATAQNVGTTMKTHTHLRCPCARAQTSITSLVANGASATYGKNNQILLVRKLCFQELLSLRLLRLKALVFLTGAFFILEVFDCSFYSTGRFIALQNAPTRGSYSLFIDREGEKF